MNRFEAIIDQKLPVWILTTFLKTGFIPHALLFTGIEGVGKKTAALTFAMALNCAAESGSEKPCGVCRSCRKIESGLHPDVLYLKPSGGLIRIDQIRNLLHLFALKPNEARYRVALIADAHCMNPEAGNAFLKILEEPPAGTLFILTAPQRGDLLPTIVSRCRHIGFKPVSETHLAQMLIERNGLDSQEAAIIAAMAGGSFGKALSMTSGSNQGDWLERRNWLVRQIASLPSQPLALLLALAEKLSREKERLGADLQVIKSWLRDLIVCKYNPDRIMNKDLTDQIQYASQQVAVAQLVQQFEIVSAVEQKLKGNANLRLMMEVMCLKLARQIP